MKIKIAVILFIIGAMVFVYSQTLTEDYAQAEDFPRDAVIYAQFADLPAFIEIWENSELINNYFSSQSYGEFQNGHIMLKLAERMKEFDDAAGFPLDVSMFGTFAEKRGALAVYDIGRLEMVFVAPVNDEIFNAIGFVENKDRFDERTLADGTIYYSRAFKVDGGRQQQNFVFANYRGRFVLATEEKLFLRTLAVIGGKNRKDSLADEPDFTNLARLQKPHLATFWVNQERLNGDYYFKRYWLMSNLESLKRFRAAIFDLEQNEGKWTENRTFLLAEKQTATAKIEKKEANRLLKMISEDTAFYNFKSVENRPDAQAEIFSKTLFENSSPDAGNGGETWSRRDFWYRDFGSSEYDRRWRGYDDLGGKYDENIDTENDDFSGKSVQKDDGFSDSLREILAPARPKIVLSAANPQMLPAPLFMEFRRISILTLKSPNNLSREKLENLLAENLKNELTIGGESTRLSWETKTENGKSWRECNPPALGLGIAYALNGNDLIFSNSPELLRETLFRETEKTEKFVAETDESFDEISLINLAQRQSAFDDLMNKLALEKIPNEYDTSNGDFFADNIGSLLDAGKDVEKIEIRRGVSDNILREKLDFVFK